MPRRKPQPPRVIGSQPQPITGSVVFTTTPIHGRNVWPAHASTVDGPRFYRHYLPVNPIYNNRPGGYI